MTMTTRVRILTPLPADELWTKCQELVGASADTVWRQERSTLYEFAERRANEPGQDLCALMYVEYAIERPLEDEPDETTDGVPIPAGPGPFFAEVMFDTSYWWEGPNGEDCVQLHARLTCELDAWLLERFGIECWWKTETDGREGYERFTGDVKRDAWYAADCPPIGSAVR